MLWRFPARQRIQALDEKVEAMSGCLNEVMSRLDRLSADFDRLSEDLDQVRQRLDVEASARHEQTDRSTAMLEVVVELQKDSKTLADSFAGLQVDGKTASEVMAEHASVLDALQEKGLRHERSLNQTRADITRIERQAAADLAELRTTNTALARVVLNVNGAGGSAAS